MHAQTAALLVRYCYILHVVKPKYTQLYIEELLYLRTSIWCKNGRISKQHHRECLCHRVYV